MIRIKLPQRFGLILIASVVIGAAASFAQTPATNRLTTPSITITPSGGTIQFNPRPGQGSQDLFNSLVASSASIDMDSPVTAKAEFDPPVVVLGGRAIYRVVLTALSESVKLPDQLPAPNGLTLLPGGSGQTYQPGAGAKLQPQTTINFRVTAPSPGTFTMPSFHVTAYGKPVTVPAATLTVAPPGTAGTREAPRLLVELPDGDIYVGQTLKVRVVLFDPGDGTVQALSQPRITGDAIFAEPISFGQRREVIRRDGRAYPAFIHEVIITPMREGEQTLVAQGHTVSTRLIPGQPGAVQSYSSLIDSDPLTMTVKPLPKDGLLPGFTGAIGTFQLEAPKLSTNEVRVGDPLALTVTLRGDGNIGRVALPQFPFLREWQTFPPVGDPGPAYVIQQRGFTTFNYTLIPLTERITTTPALPFSYFDPKKGAYVDITISPVPVTVKPAPPGTMAQLQTPPPSTSSSGADESSAREKELAMTGLAEAPGRTVNSSAPWQQRPWFLALQLLPAAGLCGLWAWDRRRRYVEKHPEVIRKRRARRELRRQLRAARRAAVAQDAHGFAASAVRALREACAPHGAANPEALVCADVLEELSVSERQSRSGEVIRHLFAAADSDRFGGSVKNGSDLLALQPDLERLLGQLRARL